jgi:hypothetical protein
MAKNLVAAASGRLGGLKTASRRTPEERSESARRAAVAKYLLRRKLAMAATKALNQQKQEVLSNT